MEVLTVNLTKLQNILNDKELKKVLDCEILTDEECPWYIEDGMWVETVDDIHFTDEWDLDSYREDYKICTC